jgi:hypothetical protein
MMKFFQLSRILMLLLSTYCLQAQNRQVPASPGIKPWEAEAKRYGQEDISKRNRFAKHFIQANGTGTMFTSPASQHYLDGQVWQDIDPNIVAYQGPYGQTYAFANEKNAFKTYYPTSILQNEILTLLPEGAMYEKPEAIYVNDAQGNTIYQYAWNNSVSTVVDKHDLRYEHVLPQVGIRYTQQSDARKMDVVIDNAQFFSNLPKSAAYIVIKEKITLPAQWVVTQDDAGINLYANQIWVAQLPKPVAYETPSKNKVYTTDADMMAEGEISYTQQGNEITVLTQFPLSWLTARERKFPLYLDPVINYYPTNVANATGYQTTATGKMSGYIRITNTNTNLGWASFDISTLPSGATIASANYWGYHYTTAGDKFAAIVGLQTILPIPSTGAQLNSQIINGPVYNSNYQFGSATLNTWRVGAINATGCATIAAEVGQGATGLGFRYTSGLTTFQYQYGFNAANATLRPYLEIDYSTTPCAGQPTAPVASASVINACGTPFTLSLTGFSNGSGITFQWQSSPVGQNSWTNLGAAQASPSYVLTQSVPTDYQCIVTCTNSNLTATSNIVSVGQNPPTSCYCTPLATGTTYWINNFSTTGGTTNITNNNSGLGITNVGYSNYTGVFSCSQNPGQSISYSASGSGTSTFGWGIYVDWNQDGDFTDAGETMFTTTAYTNAISGSFTVPLNALPGTTRMRIYNDFLSSTAATGPCGPFASTSGSEAEDYTFIVSAPCTTANAGAISTATNSVCNGAQVVLSSNAQQFIGSTLQWQVSSTQGGPYANVVGGVGAQSLNYTTPALTPGTYYYILQQTCANCGPCSALSNEIMISVNSISAPTSISSAQCGPGIPAASVTSTAGALGTGQFFWYSAPSAGTLLQQPPYGPLVPYYFNEFSTPSLGNASLTGNANVGSGILTITPNATSQTGAIQVNAPGVQSNKYRVEFDLTTVGAGVGNMADGISYSFSDDGVPGIEASMNAENGTGSKLKVAFVAYGAGITGVYLMYNCLVNEQTPTTTGVLAHINDLTWLNATKHVTLDIDSLGRATLMFDNTILFNQVQLPVAYLNANRSNWKHIVKGRTGGIAMGMSVDNLDIKMSSFTTGYDTYQTSVSNTTTFYVSETGTNGCPSPRVPVTVTVSPPVTPAATASPSLVVCPTAQVTLSASGAGIGGSYLWNTIPVSGTDTVFSTAIPGTYTVTAINATGCSATTSITITTLPVVTGTTSANPTSICYGESSTLTATPIPQCGAISLGFQGAYGPVNWTQTVNNSNGFVNFLGAPSSVIITSGNNGSANSGTTNYAITVPCPGTITFNWSYTNIGFAADDFPMYRINNGTALLFSGYNLVGSQTQSGTQSITVNAGDVVTLIANTVDNDPFACQITLSNFSAPAPPVTGTAIFWTAATGGTNAGLSPALVTPTSSGTVTYYAEFTTDITGCINPIRVPVSLSVSAPIALNVSAANGSLCNGESTTLSATAPTATSITWSAGTIPSTGSLVNITPASTTTYTATVTDASGCTTASSVAVIVNDTPNVTVSSSPLAPVIVCTQTQQVTLSANGASFYTWSGGINDGIPFTANTGTTTYTVSGTSALGCTGTATIDVTGNNGPTVTATAATPIICNGSSSVLSGDGALTYVWSGGPSTPTWSVTPTSYSVYTVTGTDAGGCTNSATVDVDVFSLPVVSASGPASVCTGTAASLSASAVPFIVSAGFSWEPGSLSGNNPSTNPSTSTIYTVTATDGNGCSNTSTVTVNVENVPLVSINAMPITPMVCIQTEQVTLSGNGANTYTWSGGLIDATPFTASLGTITYTVTGTGVNGCTNTATIDVTGNNNPNVSASATPSNVCAGNTADLMALGNAQTYSWSGGPAAAVWTIQPGATNTYTVTASNGLGCTSTATVSVLVNTVSNALPIATSTNTNTQPDGSSVLYTNINCDVIASVNDGVGGIELGATTAQVNLNGSVQTHNGQPYVNRWYQITPTNNGPALVTLYYSQADFDTYNTYALSNNWPLLPTGSLDAVGIGNLRITKVDNGGLGNNPVILTPSSVTWNGLNSYWEIQINTPGFSQFYAHAQNPNNVPLPAMVRDFSGYKLGTSNRLAWTTQSEYNNAYFTLEYSTDGVQFKALEKVPTQAINGNSNHVLQYSFIHTSPLIGHNYYRLRQTDIDGQSQLEAKVVDLIHRADGGVIRIYPNPTAGVLQVNVYEPSAGDIKLVVRDMSGRVVKSVEALTTSAQNQLTIDLSDVAQGLYTLQCYSRGALILTERVRKQ